ncbi:amidohydrolase family protein [uncultured Paracoccus sp.]|uniref:amidohydrolase family protein n=1 Tax=uncultured Paracoccus sp. TaxID=189685 RepID=UPI0026097FC7|nr:amidohydrolase family protein [uncultured Paracoccus sp.]
MISRRLFTATALSSGVLALSGCGSGLARPGRQADLGAGAIDAHMHLFNGRDVPALGFLRQVILPDLGNTFPVAVIGPFAEMIVTFLLQGTRDAAAELAGLGQAPLPRISPAEDEARLARAIDGYFGAAQARAETQLAASRAMRSAASGEAAAVLLPEPDQQLLSALSDAAGVPVGEAAAGMAAGDQPSIAARRAVPSTGQQLAPGLLNPDRRSATASSLSLSNTLQWAMLMTRDRAVIRDQAARLYGRPTEARIFCNHLVDMALWLNATEPQSVSPMAQQVDLAARLSQREARVLVLNFVPFCPLRAAIEGASVLEGVQRAITQNGFAGVKLYPPMGFRPDDNSAISFAHARPDIARNPPPRAALDRALGALYRWCAENDVPIATHASHSMGAGPGTKDYSAPWLWAPVLRDHPDLRVNLAHFGGFNRHQEANWQVRLGQMMTEDRNLYFDTGYWDEAARDVDSAPGGPLAMTQAFLATYPLAGERMLYGSDWHMIAREPDHPDYHRMMRDFVGRLTPDKAAQQRIMGGNALSWLGLDRPEGAQFRRLAAHHGGNPAWRALFDAG